MRTLAAAVFLGALAGCSGGGPTSPYSFSLTTFSPEGRLHQIEFAFKAVEAAPPCAAIVLEGGVVLAKAARAGSRGSDEERSPHVCRVTERVSATYAGLPADFRALVRALQEIAVEHARAWGEDAGAAYLADELASRVQEHTQLGGLRPFGCAVLLADSRGLWRVDPSGWCAPWTATAAGLGATAANAALADRIDGAGFASLDDAAAFLAETLAAADESDDRVFYTAALAHDADAVVSLVDRPSEAVVPDGDGG